MTRRASVIEQHARASDLLQRARADVRPRESRGEAPEHNRAGDAPLGRVVAARDHDVRERQKPRSLGRLDTIREDRTSASRGCRDRDASGRRPDRRDHLARRERRAGGETSCLPRRERPCELCQGQERSNLRARVRVDTIGSRPEIASNRRRRAAGRSRNTGSNTGGNGRNESKSGGLSHLHRAYAGRRTVQGTPLPQVSA